MSDAPLAKILLEALVERAPEAPPAPEASALEARLRELHGAARAAWPAFSVEAAEFVRCAAERLDVTIGLDEALTRLRASDLYLACACARGDSAALRAFEDQLLSQVPALPCRTCGAAISLRRGRRSCAPSCSSPRQARLRASPSTPGAAIWPLAARRRHPHRAAPAQGAEEARRQRPRGCGPPPLWRRRPRALARAAARQRLGVREPARPGAQSARGEHSRRPHEAL